uniref:Ribosomal protein S3 n=1 Tax=Salix viminalis TaxID=40686 RepID=A0A6N2KGN8_SALVM
MLIAEARRTRRKDVSALYLCLGLPKGALTLEVPENLGLGVKSIAKRERVKGRPMSSALAFRYHTPTLRIASFRSLAFISVSFSFQPVTVCLRSYSEIGREPFDPLSFFNCAESEGDCCQSKVDRDPRRERIEASYEDLTYETKSSVSDRQRDGKKTALQGHMARKGNPISVRLYLNRSSDSSRFSEGDRQSHRMAHYAPLQQMRVFGGTGEPRELVRCVGQRAYRCAVLDWKPMGLSFQMTTASSCCEGVARNRPPPDQVPVAGASPIWGKGSSALTLSPGIHHRLGLSESRVIAPPIKQERSGSFHGGVTIDSINGKLVYQNVNLRSYLGSPPTTKVSLGRCIILHFSKRIFIHFFLPHGRRRLKRRKKTRPGKGKGFGKVGPIRCLHSSNNTEEERNKVRGRGAGKRVESIRLDDREKENEIRIWPKKKEGYGYHDRSPSRKKNLSKLLLVSGAFKHPKDAGVVNDISFLIENDDSFRKTKLFHFFFPKKYRSDGPTSHLLKSKRTLPAVRLSLNYLVMQYFLNTKNQIHFDPVVVLNHFVSPGVAEPFTMGGANAQGRSLDKRIRSRIAFFVESLTSEKKCLAEAKKRLTHFIRQANDLRFAGTTKTTISLFPFFGRLKGAEIAGTECGKYGKTSCNLFNQKIDYAPAEYLLLTESQGGHSPQPREWIQYVPPYSRHTAPGPECGRVFKPHARFSRFMGRLAKIFDPNLRIYEDEPRLRYRPSLLLNLAIALILAGPPRFKFLIEIEILFH